MTRVCLRDQSRCKKWDGGYDDMDWLGVGGGGGDGGGEGATRTSRHLTAIRPNWLSISRSLKSIPRRVIGSDCVFIVFQVRTVHE